VAWLAHHRGADAHDGRIDRMRRAHVRGAVLALGVATAGVLASAQSPVKPCDTSPTPAWCNAVVGDRAEGWLAQPRSEVMARKRNVRDSEHPGAPAGLHDHE